LSVKLTVKTLLTAKKVTHYLLSASLLNHWLLNKNGTSEQI